MPNLDVRRWNGSLVTALDQEQLTPGDFHVLKNFIFDESGLPTVRGGRRPFNSSAISSSYIYGLYHFRSGWTARPQGDWLICSAGDKIYKAERDGTFDQILDGLDEDINPSFCTLRGWLIFASGSDLYPRCYFWDHGMSEMGTLDKAPNAIIVAAHQNRLWIVDRDYPSRLWYSAPYEPNNWTFSEGAGFITVNPSDGNTISALVPGYAGEMIVFKDGPSGGSTYRIQGLAQPFSLSPLSQTVGAMGHRLATMVGDKDIFFASRRGLHSLRRVFEHGDLESQFIDYEVSDRWRSIPDFQKKRAVCVDDYPHDTWWLFVDTNNDSINDTGWLFNYRHMTPRNYPKVSDVDFGAGGACVYRDERRGRDTLVTGLYEYVNTEHNPEANDNGTDYTWEAKLAPFDGGDALKTKAWKKLWITQDNWGHGDMTVTWYGDNRPPSSTTVSLNPANAPIPMHGHRLGETRMFPPKYRGRNLVHMREGGTSLNVSLSGTRGRTRLRGMRINLDVGREDVNADVLFVYNRAQDASKVE